MEPPRDPDQAAARVPSSTAGYEVAAYVVGGLTIALLAYILLRDAIDLFRIGGG
ncbi:hypothetical protein [Brevundimonas faecalis]|uniref:Uncharacterized protein n=1 Tax=Brevundimonas faecalis TaxID=947378 RepID=A0ABV2RER8_9CAUL